MLGLIILIFVRMNNSRIGRGWIAIREDEKAADAMGVNVFGLKLLAFAGGLLGGDLVGQPQRNIPLNPPLSAVLVSHGDHRTGKRLIFRDILLSRNGCNGRESDHVANQKC